MALAFAPGAFYILLGLTCAKLYEGEDGEGSPPQIQQNSSDTKALLNPVEDAAKSAVISYAKNPNVQSKIIDAVKNEAMASVSNMELPPHWKARIDEGSGSTYYVNTATGETSWERPF
eukprot:CAMPEP_0114507256 /NCGR_PEP_ID=MMETSP0109-20121206/11906_1 /TAXON_ID=29199 /ORGANISM="Chlorarachnion reptans, Strain CCCM449" /LENGTH=117 /DNA_ID=CAMNT_0001685983 /DNA_START=318 /DNA_END=671 /DNA_ORIENTATION=-